MPRIDVSMSSQEIQEFLTPARPGVLATLGRDGWPHLSAMWFLPGTDEVRMWTYAKSQKALNARRDPRGALLIEDGTTYDALRGVSLRGALTVIDDFEKVRAIGIELYRRYTEPSLGIPVEAGPIEGIERQARKRVGLVLAMDDVASWDHAKLS